MGTISKNTIFLLLAAFCVGVAKSISENVKEDTLQVVSEVFDEIEKNHQKLRKVFQDIITNVIEDKNDDATEETPRSGTVEFRKKSKEEDTCRCIPYHLCYPETGEQISDGRFLLESRVSSYVCDNPNEVCCMRYNPIQPYPSLTRMKPFPQPKCGYGYTPETKPVGLVDDPTLSSFGQFPWTILIARSKKYACVGTLIHPKVILTAAHCVNTSDTFTVRAGEWDFNSRSEPFKHQSRNIAQIIQHPQFCLDNLFYDVALLIVEEEFQLQENINTICLTKAFSVPKVANPDQCVVSGWGALQPFGQLNKIMTKVNFTLVSHKQCENSFRATRLGSTFQLDQNFLCAYGSNGVDACRGNGGAPLMCPHPDEPDRYQQVGLVSWGVGCAGGLPSVFTKISHIKDWIDMEFDALGFSKEHYTE